MPDLGWVTTGEHNGTPVLEVHGEVDLSNADDIQAGLEEAMAGRRGGCYLDLSDVAYLDSSGIRVLFRLAERLQARREQLYLIVPKETMVHRVLELTDLPGLVPMLSSRSEIPQEA